MHRKQNRLNFKPADTVSNISALSSLCVSQMSDISEEDCWKSALISILEELDDKQYHKMQYLLEIPKSEKTGKCREEIAQKLIEHFGLEGSISAVRAVMEEIPRRDEAVQDLLRPFVEKLRNKREKENLGEFI